MAIIFILTLAAISSLHTQLTTPNFLTYLSLPSIHYNLCAYHWLSTKTLFTGTRLLILLISPCMTRRYLSDLKVKGSDLTSKVCLIHWPFFYHWKPVGNPLEYGRKCTLDPAWNKLSVCILGGCRGCVGERVWVIKTGYIGKRENNTTLSQIIFFFTMWLVIMV